MSLFVPSITSNVYAMYIMYILLFYCVFIIITIILICLTVYLSAAFIEWFYVYIAVMSVLTRDKILNFFVETIKKYVILSYLILVHARPIAPRRHTLPIKGHKANKKKCKIHKVFIYIEQ